MQTCHENVGDTPAVAGVKVVALAGNPNSGKTTIFNALTGLRQKVANYPGVTVSKRTGQTKLPDGRVVQVTDLPGTYSLISRSPDERVAMEVLRGIGGQAPPDVVVAVVDASNLQRNLYLVSQLIELGRPMVVALNMVDVARSRGQQVDVKALEAELGVPVVPVVGHKREGIEELKAAVALARVAKEPAWHLPEAMREAIHGVGECLKKEHCLECGPDECKALAERLLVGDAAEDVAKLGLGETVGSAVKSASVRLRQLGIDPVEADIAAHYRWIEGVAARVVTPLPLPGGVGATDEAAGRQRTWTERVDRVVMHPWLGFGVFAAVMASLFFAIFWLADPMMGAAEGVVASAGEWVGSMLSDGPIRDLVVDGIFAGVGGVVVFVPQIAMLFLFLAILEDSGYLARAAFLMDRVLAKVGLHGKSFIPLLSSFACAIPGIMATRTIESRRDRLATIAVAPFMGCSARLPVYALLIGAFFAAYGPWAQAGIMFALYALGVVAAFGVAWVFRRSLLKGTSSAFILEMPPYKVPQVSAVARQVWTNTREFLVKAGTIIFCLSVILWALMYYPRLPEARVAEVSAAAVERGLDEEGVARAVEAAQSEYTIAGRMGHLMEPAIRPLGYDWKMGVGLVASFGAREVFVSAMSISYAAGSEEDTEGLAAAMLADVDEGGRPVWTPVVTVSIPVWFALAMQCLSTVAVVKRETGGWGWPLFMIAYMNGIAYVAALVVYQVGSRIWG